MARGHHLNTSIVLAAVHGLSGLFRAVSAVEPTLRAPLSGTFLQTLPDLACYATEGARFISAQLSTDSVSALPERFGY